MSTSKHPAWNNLLAWLQSHGMDASSASLHVEARPVEAGASYSLIVRRTCRSIYRNRRRIRDVRFERRATLDTPV